MGNMLTIKLCWIVCLYGCIFASECNLKGNTNPMAFECPKRWCGQSEENKAMYSIEEQKCIAGNTNSVVTAPKLVSIDWYIATREGKPTIAVSLQWKPASDSSVKSLEYYRVFIYRKGSSNEVYPKHTINVCSINTKLVNSTSVFTACYGNNPGDDFLQPNDRLTFYIVSYPNQELENHKENNLEIDLTIPPCVNLKCHSCFKVCTLSLAIENYFCNNRTIMLKYNIPQRSNTTVEGDFLFYQGKIEAFLKFSSSKQFEYYQLPKEVSLYNKFKIQLTANSDEPDPGRTRKIEGNFTKAMCEPLPQSFRILTVPIVIPIVIAIILLIIILFIWYKCRHCLRNSHQNILHKNSHEQETHNKDIPCGVVEIQMPTNIYIVYSNDHPKHKEVVLTFASFLNCDLGFNVILDLWEQNEVFKDYISWMEKALQRADKILVVWSPGAKYCWESTGQRSTPHPDMLTPIVKKIKSDLQINKNIGKFLFTHFEYSDLTDVSNIFRDKSINIFHLMQQFREVYFQIIDSEKCISSGFEHENKIAFDKYSDPNINKYGSTLQHAIAEMCAVAKADPNWFKFSETVCCHAKEIDEEVVPTNHPIMVNALPSVQTIPAVSLQPMYITEEGIADYCVQPESFSDIYVSDRPVQPEAGCLSQNNFNQRDVQNRILQNDMLNNKLKQSRTPTENSQSRTPIEHSQNLQPTEYIPLNNILLEEEVTKRPIPKTKQDCISSISSEDSGIELKATSPESIQSENSLRNRISFFAFHENDSSAVLNITSTSENVRPTVSLEPIDMSNDPWVSLALINNI